MSILLNIERVEEAVADVKSLIEEKTNLIELFKEREASVICTISPAIIFDIQGNNNMNISEKVEVNGKVALNGIIDCAKAGLENNIPVGLGNDAGCPYVTHYDFWRELVHFKNNTGVSNAFTLYTATKRNAEIVNIEDMTVNIEVGKSADFLITDKNPLEDLHALRTPYMVVTNGKVIKNPKIRKFQDIETELDKIM